MNDNLDSKRSFLWGILLLLALTFCGIFDHGLWSPEEPRVAESGREMLDPNHNLAVPMLNDEPFVEKPPLVYWSIAISLWVFGTYDWAARIPNIFFALGTLIFVYLLGKRLFGKRGLGIGAGLVLMTSAGFAYLSHRISCDTGLVFFVSGAIYFLYRAFNGSAWWYLPFYLSSCGGFFSKGFIAFAFLGLFFLVWVVWTGDWKQLRRARPWIGIPLLFIPIAFWFRELANYGQGNLLYDFLIKNHLYRFVPVAGKYYGVTRGQPFYFYLIKELPTQFAPWIVILVLAIGHIWSKRREPATKFLVSWFAPSFLFLSASGTKFGTYLLPIIPPLALLVAEWFYTKGREKLFKTLGFAMGILVILGWSVALLIFRLDEEKSMKPFCEQLSSMIDSDTKLYGFIGDDEIVRGSVPFYVKRYLIPLREEKDIATISNMSRGKIVVITYNDDDIKLVKKYFPYVWLKRDKKYGRNMWALSNKKIKWTSE